MVEKKKGERVRKIMKRKTNLKKQPINKGKEKKEKERGKSQKNDEKGKRGRKERKGKRKRNRKGKATNK